MGSGRPFHAVGPALAKARGRPYVLSGWCGACSKFTLQCLYVLTYELSVMVSHCPWCLSELCTLVADVASRRHWQSARQNGLIMPCHKLSSVGWRAFSVAALSAGLEFVDRLSGWSGSCTPRLVEHQLHWILTPIGYCLRAWAPKWRMLSSENDNKKHSVDHYAVVVVDFCVWNAFLSRLLLVSYIFVFNWLSQRTRIEYCRSVCQILFGNESVTVSVGTRRP